MFLLNALDIFAYIWYHMRVLNRTLWKWQKILREYILSTKMHSNIITTDKTVKFEELKHQKSTKNSMIKILKVEWE